MTEIESQHTPVSNEAHKKKLAAQLQSVEGRIAEIITKFSGSMWFAYLHAIWFCLWIIINQGLLKGIIPPFDPFPYGLLTMTVSLEAIFLSTFIMVAQNRQMLVDTYRDLEEEQEQIEEDKEQEALEHDVEDIQEDVQDIQEDVQDIQKDLDNIIQAISFIQQKLPNVEKLIQGNGKEQEGKTPTKKAKP